MAKRLDKVPRLQKATLTAQTKMKSTNSRRMYILAGCYYLITKGWSFLFSKEQRIAKKLHHFFPIQKIWNENGVIIFDKDFEYEVVQEEKEAKLKFDTEGIPIKKREIVISEKPDKRRLVYNELVVMNIINEYYMKYNELGSDNSLAHTKVSKNTISSQQYTKLPLVKKDGKCIGIYKKIEVLNTTGTLVYDFLCQYLTKERGSQKKCEGVFIGDICCLNKTIYGNILLGFSKEEFLDQAIDESKFDCFNDKVSCPSLVSCLSVAPCQRLNEGVKIQPPQSPTNISNSMEDNPLNNIRGSPFVEYQSTVFDYSNKVFPINNGEILHQIEDSSNKGVIPQNNESESYVDMNRYKNNKEYLQIDHLSDMGLKEYGFIQGMYY
ncbi:hypothetical protein CL6EHI_109270 [Entamoeba histolytica]|uniref:Uncharacterized protein n=2 Tax=Entamoeba histolytica TaxID=5759 RepID=C4M7N0_ENTH1|nr:hypothetical protein EHI_109270 [Entamoeba histolytica HM-1:IMSS]EAL42752.1 hypothetical protein EHI_109270 [Entamoeba histolytica HM-1:IMSS]GAT97550.1 hypothetical protein CL6EHI_109270 [Entamoeba histolytica]|eukprot:XP_648138.1 hypothetical protein EHI_109270 [Entamoeba histolytica HM-1:IMSS]